MEIDDFIVDDKLLNEIIQTNEYLDKEVLDNLIIIIEFFKKNLNKYNDKGENEFLYNT